VARLGAVQKVIPKAAPPEEAVPKAAKDQQANPAQLEIPLEAAETTTLQKGNNRFLFMAPTKNPTQKPQ